MAHLFTVNFQFALAECIEELLEDWLGKEHSLEVGVESKPITDWNGIADIWIASKIKHNSVRIPRILNIEIEHYSGAKQANQNIQHVINWVKLSQAYRASIIHLVNEPSNITDLECTRLFTYGYENRSRRFNYDFRVYDTEDQRATRALAERFRDKYDFKALIWQHLRFLKLI